MHYLYERGGAVLLKKCVGFSENHDDGGDSYLPRRLAEFAAMASLPFTRLLVGQGQRYGTNFIFRAGLWVPRSDFKEMCTDRLKTRNGKREYHKAGKAFLRAASRAVFRSPESECRPVAFSVRDCDVRDVVHTARIYHDRAQNKTDRVLSIVLNGGAGPGGAIDVGLSKTFGLNEGKLDQFVLVNLLDGSVMPAAKQVTLRLETYGVQPWVLVEQERLGDFL